LNKISEKHALWDSTDYEPQPHDEQDPRDVDGFFQEASEYSDTIGRSSAYASYSHQLRKLTDVGDFAEGFSSEKALEQHASQGCFFVMQHKARGHLAYSVIVLYDAFQNFHVVA